ncbi:magnesium transporter MgtE N-terminal domain-containing protein [Sporosarcina sp. FA9]|uniref:magnesium transporter MgtE N-terminal domain-containing protein n=1 Tax=Sporosarcina sp. FA9 TaxID=3413030 RepID=UPI003F65B58B
MAKKKKVEDLSAVNEEKSSNKLLVVILSILLPLLAISAVFLIIAKFTDVNVFDKAKELTGKLPFVDEEKDFVGETDLILEERVVTLQAELSEKETQLVKLQAEVEGSANEKKELLEKLEELQYEIEILKVEKDTTKRTFTEIVSTFERMSAKSAAPILTEMADEEVMRILTSMKPELLAAILEKMTPKDAAKYTSLMTK